MPTRRPQQGLRSLAFQPQRMEVVVSGRGQFLGSGQQSHSHWRARGRISPIADKCPHASDRLPPGDLLSKNCSPQSIGDQTGGAEPRSRVETMEPAYQRMFWNEILRMVGQAHPAFPPFTYPIATFSPSPDQNPFLLRTADPHRGHPLGGTDRLPPSARRETGNHFAQRGQGGPQIEKTDHQVRSATLGPERGGQTNLGQPL